MGKIRVLIVNESATMRRLLSAALAADSAIEVVGTAANGRIALAKLPQTNPDVVTLELEAPALDALATLAELRKTHPHLPVILLSSQPQDRALASVNARWIGPAECVIGSCNVESEPVSIEAVSNQLIAKIKTLCPREDQFHPAAKAKGSSQRFDIVAIGVSTGGPNALTEIFRKLPAQFPLPIVIVQHMPPLFTRYLAERLDAVSFLSVREAVAGEQIVPGEAWVAPGDFHMALSRSEQGVTIQLHQGPPENSCRPAVDVLLRSVAELYGPAALAVVLTGMGQDGRRGCEAIATAGGRVLVQDEATSVVWGMPRAVADAGLADAVLPLRRIPTELIDLASQGRASLVTSQRVVLPT